MKSNYKRLGDLIERTNVKNKESLYDRLLGININKYFMPSVANIVGTDLSKYKIVKPGQFSCNRMHVGRDYRLPIALSKENEPFIVSPAYDVFEISKPKELVGEYLMMWFSRAEFDRNSWFYTDTDVRGKLGWDSFCDMTLPIPTIEEQRAIVAEYQTVTDRIELNEQINTKLEETAQALYKHWFVDFEFPDKNGKPYKSSGGKMVFNEELENEVPEGWEVKTIESLSLLITKGTTPKNMYSSKNGLQVPYIKAQALGKNRLINPLKLLFIDVDIHENSLKRSIIIDNDILFTITGANIGDFALYKNTTTTANTNQNVAIIRLNDSNVNATFIYWLLLSNWHHDFINKNRQEAVQPNLNLEMIRNIEVLFPTQSFMKLITKPISQLIHKKKLIHDINIKLFKLENLILSKLANIKSIQTENAI